MASSSGNIYEYTPGGVQSTFASGLSFPYGLAFNSAGNLFVSSGDGNIYEYTPDGTQSAFASVFPERPVGLAFDSAGDLFVASYFGGGLDGTGNIYEFTPGGAQSAFASGLNFPVGLAFDSADDLFVSDSYNIFEYTPGGVQSTFASSPVGLGFLSFQPESVPEPSMCALSALGLAMLSGFRRRK